MYDSPMSRVFHNESGLRRGDQPFEPFGETSLDYDDFTPKNT